MKESVCDLLLLYFCMNNMKYESVFNSSHNVSLTRE